VLVCPASTAPTSAVPPTPSGGRFGCRARTARRTGATARIDPNVNPAVAEALGNRTIVNVPMRLLDQPFGMLGTGTFGDEGVQVPTDEQLRYLVGLAGQLVVASARTLLLRQREDAARQRVELERKLAERQRLESLGQLAGGVAHDFNNLLTVILASASLLNLEERDPAGAAELGMVTGGAFRPAELTRGLPALGQRQQFRLVPSDVGAILTSVVGMLRRVIPADISIELVIGPALPLIRAESSQIEQVIMNLCLNARDAMPTGGTLTITADAVTGVSPRGDVRITVSDTGTGMAPGLLARVFEPFFTTKGEGRGSGLGLAVCRGITEQHGGTIRVHSEEGRGTTFEILLPAADGTTVAAPAAIAAPRTGHERILIADDQPHVLRVMERILTQAGYVVVSVADGKLAIETALREPFDLVILDAVMPELGGRGAYEQLRAARPGLKVLFASGYGAEELTARFLADTEVPLLRKPFSPGELLHAVRDRLDAAS